MSRTKIEKRARAGAAIDAALTSGGRRVLETAIARVAWRRRRERVQKTSVINALRSRPSRRRRLPARILRVGIAVLTAPALAAAQSPVSLGPLALIALVPWLWATRRAGTREAVALGALVGTLYGCLVAPWIPEALRALGSSGATTLLGLLVTAAWAKLALFAAIGGLVQRMRSRSSTQQVAAVALAFGLGERALGGWHLGVPWALTGHSQLATLGVAQLAAVGGVPLLSALVGAINQAIVLAIDGVPPARRFALALGGAWAALALFGLSLAEAARPHSLGEAGLSLLIVQPNLPRSARWAWEAQRHNLERIAAYTEGALAEVSPRPHAILWPENLLTAPVDADPALSRELQARVDAWGITLISGLVQSAASGAPHHYRSSVVWIDPRRGVRDGVDKTRAIPLLESSREFPGSSLLAALYGQAARWSKVEEAQSAGPLRGDFTVTPVLCYEALFPGVSAERRAPDSVALLNLADDSWVAGESASRQLMDLARFRAIEQRLPLIRLAHGGLSVVTDPFGRIVESLPLDRYAHATVEVRPQPPPTLRERLALAALPLATGLGIWWVGRAGSSSWRIPRASSPGGTRP